MKIEYKGYTAYIEGGRIFIYDKRNHSIMSIPKPEKDSEQYAKDVIDQVIKNDHD